jgi:hypothetical protein
MNYGRNHKMTCNKSRLVCACPRCCLATARRGGIYRLMVAAVLCLVLLTALNAQAEPSSAQYKEYEVKAAFIFNFLKFVDWPKEKMADDPNQITIGIIGKDPFGSAVDIFKGKTIEDRKVVAMRFEGLEQLNKLAESDKNERLEAIKNCHLLFICSSEQKQIREITDIVDKHAVLTVGDTEQFIESGGIINFFMEEGKIRFDINLAAAKKAGLEMRSQLLRLARKVIKDEPDAAAPKDNTTKKEGG